MVQIRRISLEKDKLDGYTLQLRIEKIAWGENEGRRANLRVPSYRHEQRKANVLPSVTERRGGRRGGEAEGFQNVARLR